MIVSVSTNQKMDPSTREKLCNDLDECMGTFLIHSDHSRLHALFSIDALKEMPAIVLNLIVELASDAYSIADDNRPHYVSQGCSFCGTSVHVSCDAMKQKRGFDTWFRIQEECDEQNQDAFLCERCINTVTVCLDCDLGVLSQQQFYCWRCNRGALCEECESTNQELTVAFRKAYCLECMIGIMGRPTVKTRAASERGKIYPPIQSQRKIQNRARKLHDDCS